MYYSFALTGMHAPDGLPRELAYSTTLDEHEHSLFSKRRRVAVGEHLPRLSYVLSQVVTFISEVDFSNSSIKEVRIVFAACYLLQLKMFDITYHFSTNLMLF